MPYPGCGCGNWWNSPSRSVCGPFDEPTVRDEGRCSPHHQSIDDEAPVLPVAQCDDDQFTVIYQPEDPLHPFVVSARLFDEDCEVITDENGEAITLILTGLL